MPASHIVFEPQPVAVDRLAPIVLQQQFDRAGALVALAEHDRRVGGPGIGLGRLEPRIAVDRAALAGVGASNAR